MMTPLLLISISLASAGAAMAQNFLAPSQIASKFALPSSTSLAFPSATLSSSDAADFLKKTSNWGITKNGHISQPQDVSFVQDPIESNNSSPVLAVLYPQGSFSNGTGGASFSTYWNDSSSTGFRTVQLSYQVGFTSDFAFVKGGKLPGLRGGDLDGCDGGQDQDSCFSMRFMWRTNGAGEAYAYIPSSGQKALCKDSNVLCNSDGFGTSIDRGSFSFVPGVWNQVDMVVGLNNPVGTANGFVAVYYNGVLAINQTSLQIRTKSSVSNVQGMFFSTFFGGNDASWASPTNQSTYYRNFQLFGSDDASSLKSSASRSTTPVLSALLIATVGLAAVRLLSVL